MCLTPAPGLEGCFGEHISSMEDTFFWRGLGSHERQIHPRVVAHPLASFPSMHENCPPSLLQLCAPGVDLAWGLVPVCVVGQRTAGRFGGSLV